MISFVTRSINGVLAASQESFYSRRTCPPHLVELAVGRRPPLSFLHGCSRASIEEGSNPRDLSTPKFRLLNCTEFSSDMSSIVRHVSSLLRQPFRTVEPLSNGCHQLQQLQQCRGIRVMVENGDLERALTLMQRTMQSSGMERMIKQVQRHHIKNSEKRVLARKKLEQKIRSQDLARKLKAILLKKVRGL